MTLAVLAVVLVGYLVLPFAGTLLMAAVFASTFSQTFERLARGLKGRRNLAGGLVVVGVIMIIVLPVVFTTLAAAQQAQDVFSSVRTTFQSKGIKGVIEELPPALQGLVNAGIEHLPRGEQQLEELIRSATARILGGVQYFFLTTGSLLFHVAMMLVAFFFMLVDGPMFVGWLIEVSPLAHNHMGDMLSDFKNVSAAVLVGSVGTAAVQTVIAFFGFLMAGLTHPLWLSAATFVCAFIPLVGAGAVVVAAGVIQFFTDHNGTALFLVIWGLGVVATIDNFVKPRLMRGRMEVNSGIIFFALLGGVSAFGPVGLVAGPLIVAFFLAVVRMCRKELQSLETLEHETTES